MLKANCIFSNNGARVGVVHLFALHVQADDGTDWLVSPYWIADETKISEGRAGVPLSVKGPFAPLVVPGKQTVAQTYIFIVEPRDPKQISLVPRILRGTIFSWSEHDLVPQKQNQRLTINVTPEKIAVISAAHNWIDIPSEEDYEKMERMP